MKVKKAIYIDTSVDIRETFSFAHPQQVLKAVHLYAGHHYGAMLWDFESEMVSQYCKVWNTCVKLTYDVPRSTHTYLVVNFLAANFVPVKTELLARYVKFYKSFKLSKYPEVQHLAEVVSADVRSVTSKNLSLVKEMSGLNPLAVSPYNVRKAIKVSPIPENDTWRPALLDELLRRRKEMDVALMKTEDIQKVIDSLCST